jgi:isocitrate lyase
MTATLGASADGLLRRESADARWAGGERSYTAEDVIRLRGTAREEFTLARLGAEKLWNALQQREFADEAVGDTPVDPVAKNRRRMRVRDV